MPLTRKLCAINPVKEILHFFVNKQSDKNYQKIQHAKLRFWIQIWVTTENVQHNNAVFVSYARFTKKEGLPIY